MLDHGKMMSVALNEARVALDNNEVPVGAAIFHQGIEIARACNLRESIGDPLGHAELLVIQAAAKRLKTWKLTGCTLVVTLEPCLMCAGAVLNSRIDKVVFGAFDPLAGACGSTYNVLNDPRLNHQVDVVGGIMSDECSSLLTKFFELRR